METSMKVSSLKEELFKFLISKIKKKSFKIENN